MTSLSFKDKIIYIIKNEEKFSENSRRFAKDFTWDKTAELWYKLLKNKN